MRFLFAGSPILMQGPAADSNSSSWDVFVAIGAVVGFVAATIQVVSWLRDLRLRRAQTRLLEIARTQLDAEDASARAATSAAHLESIRRQIEHDLPNEARRAYVLNRIQRLERSLAEDVQEYASLRDELDDVGQLTPLAQEIRNVVEQTILPAQQQQRRKETFTIVAVCILLLLNFLPLELGPVVVDHFVTLAAPFDYLYEGELVSALITGVAFWTIVTALLGYLISWSTRPAFKRSKFLQVMTFQRLRTARTFLVVAVVAILGGLALRELFSWTEYDVMGYGGYHADPLIETFVGMLLSVGVPLAGISLTRFLAGVRLPRRHPLRRQPNSAQSIARL